MGSQFVRSSAFLAVFGMVATAASGGGSPQFIVTGESRSLMTATNVSTIDELFDSDSEFALAGDFDPFDESVDALASAPVRGGTAFVSAEAAQQSSFSSGALFASGTFASIGGSPGGADVDTETFNVFMTSFQVDATGPVMLRLHGFAFGEPGTTFQRARVTVFLLKNGVAMFFASTDGLESGTMLELDELIEAQPGNYSLQVIGNSFLADPVPGDPTISVLPKTVMQGGFNINLSFAAPSPDLSGDGIVNGTDLAMLLGAWGSCPAGELCGADLTVDGIVNGEDLAFLLGAWGPVGR